MASSSSSTSNKAWVTLATNDSYSLGALVLAHSLKTVKTVHKLAVLITPGVTPSMKRKIEAVFDEVRVVDVLDSKDEAHLALMNRPELGVTFTKLHCWTLTNYEKCVFLDADTLVLQNCDELFDREELSAAPDPGWPDCFNSGVFVYRPSQDTFGKLLEFAKTEGSFDGGDQGLLNMYFNDWSYKDISRHLSFAYNVVWSSTYSYLPALKQFGKDMKIVHFITSSKPWLQSFNAETRLATAISGGAGLQELLQLWWDLFCRHVHPELSTEMGGLAAQFARVSLGGEKTADQMAVEDYLRRQSWERGNADYLGKDSFSNIWAKINDTLQQGDAATPQPPQPQPDAAVPEVVHADGPRPLKSALKKTSTTVPPAESELRVCERPQEEPMADPPAAETPGTPTVTSPTPPSTPLSIRPEPAAEPGASGGGEPETPLSIRSEPVAAEPLASGGGEPETPLSSRSEPVAEEPVASGGGEPETPIVAAAAAEPEASGGGEPETPIAAQSAEDAVGRSDDQPPVAPKRANRGGPSEKR